MEFQDWITDEVLPSIRKNGGKKIKKDQKIRGWFLSD